MIYFLCKEKVFRLTAGEEDSKAKRRIAAERYKSLISKVDL